jgi:hypothetical protein
MERIRERIRRQREELGYPRQKFLTFGTAAYAGEPEGEGFDVDLYYHLRKANDLYLQLAEGVGGHLVKGIEPFSKSERREEGNT